jgi:alpha-mannosidase
MYEWAGKSANVELTAPAGATAAVETNLLEQPQGEPLQINSGQVAVPIRPYEILAVRLDYSPSAQ